MIRTNKLKIIAIDGPSASGKGELSRRLAKHLGYDLLDSGAIYRILAYQTKELRISAPKVNEIFIQGVKKGVSLNQLMKSKKLTEAGEKLKRVSMIALDLKISFQLSDESPLETLVFLNQKDISNQIRSDKMGQIASNWAIHRPIRDALLEKQRSFASIVNSKGLVADGRDMASHVFKEASIKLFITASTEIRTQRRAKELRIQDDSHKMNQLFLSIKQRDEQDIKREVSPLIKVKDAIEIDTSELSKDEVFNQVLSIIESKQ